MAKTKKRAIVRIISLLFDIFWHFFATGGAVVAKIGISAKNYIWKKKQKSKHFRDRGAVFGVQKWGGAFLARQKWGGGFLARQKKKIRKTNIFFN